MHVAGEDGQLPVHFGLNKLLKRNIQVLLPRMIGNISRGNWTIKWKRPRNPTIFNSIYVIRYPGALKFNDWCKGIVLRLLKFGEI